MLVSGKLQVHVTFHKYRSVGSNFLHFVQLLACSGKSQLSIYAYTHFKNIDIDWAYVISCRDYFMS